MSLIFSKQYDIGYDIFFNSYTYHMVSLKFSTRNIVSYCVAITNIWYDTKFNHICITVYDTILF